MTQLGLGASILGLVSVLAPQAFGACKEGAGNYLIVPSPDNTCSGSLETIDPRGKGLGQASSAFDEMVQGPTGLINMGCFSEMGRGLYEIRSKGPDQLTFRGEAIGANPIEGHYYEGTEVFGLKRVSEDQTSRELGSIERHPVESNDDGIRAVVLAEKKFKEVMDSNGDWVLADPNQVYSDSNHYLKPIPDHLPVELLGQAIVGLHWEMVAEEYVVVKGVVTAVFLAKSDYTELEAYAEVRIEQDRSVTIPLTYMSSNRVLYLLDPQMNYNPPPFSRRQDNPTFDGLPMDR